MTTISRNQTTSHQIERLAAQRQLYSDAKLVVVIHFVLSVPVVIILSFFAIGFPEFKYLPTAWGLLIGSLDVLLLTRLREDLRKRAAKIQELFDSQVLELELNDIKIGNLPTPEDIARSTKRYRKTDPQYEKLKDWYPPIVDTLEIQKARVVCQRANCWWDSSLRRHYSNYLALLIVVLILIEVIGGLIGGLLLEDFIIIIVIPLFPAVLFGLRQIREHRKAADSLDRLRIKADEIWRKVIEQGVSLEDAQRLSRQLQDEIFENRKRNPLIIDWVYRQLEGEMEKQLNRSAELLVTEASIQNGSA